MSYKYLVRTVNETGFEKAVKHKFKNPVSIGEKIYVNNTPKMQDGGEIKEVKKVIHFNDFSVLEIDSWD